MANQNFVVQNGLTVGTTTIFAGNGDVVTTGNISVSGAGSFGGLSSNQIYQGTSNVNVASGSITVGVGSAGNVATFNSTGLTIAGNLNVVGTTYYENITTELANSIQVSYLNGNSSINSGNIQVAASIVPSANLTYNVGSPTAWFNSFYGVSTQARYADLAENYQADRQYNPGTVVMFGGADEVTVADADTTRVAGVVSTNPAHLMNGALSGANVVPVAFTGRVPCNIIGPVAKGDLMVSAGFGYAKVNNNPQVGTVIGKALIDFPISGKGIIEVVVGRF
jgi:hypothetical protein